MDFRIYNRVTGPKIQAGKMVNLLLQTIKTKKRQRFLRDEQFKENMGPLLQKFDELKDGFNKIKIETKTTDRPIDPLGISQQEFFYGPESLDDSFSDMEKNIFLKQNLGKPSNIIEYGLEDRVIDRIKKLNRQLGSRKLKTSSMSERVNIEYTMDSNRKLMNRLKQVRNFKEKEKQYGKGMVGGSIFRLPSSLRKLFRVGSGSQTGGFMPMGQRNSGGIFTSPDDLISRFKLLGGSIKAGNNNTSLIEEFIDIAHKLRDLGVLNNQHLVKIMEAVS